ncbi:MAG TPA: hypothetical protein VFE46_07355 [Pirellulales bacterium]|nr:hypothetical protein [Pirellulales bacterium]
MLIEQAIFTSARTEHAAGYQLLARSPGVTDRQARELAVWGPSHDALNTDRDEQSSVNFHCLQCGTYCVSKTVAAGQEYSSRGGARIYTQFLLVPAAVLARFANNPFAVLRAAWAKGVLTVHDQPPATLEPFTLVGRANTVDEGLLAQLADQRGPEEVAQLIAAAMEPGIHLLSGTAHCETLFGGLLQCFPTECRTALTFTTGLRFSPRRPFRLAPVSEDAAEQHRAVRNEGVTLIDLSSPGAAAVELTGWAAYVADAIRFDQLPQLAAALQQRRPDLRWEELNSLGEQLRKELHREAIVVAANSEEPAPQPPRLAAASERLYRTDRPRNQTAAVQSNSEPRSPRTRSHSNYSRDPVSFVAGSGAKIHTVTDPACIELLEQLDDSIYDAVHAVAGAVENVNQLWTQLSERLTASTMAALREQYLHYALTLWDACHEQGMRDAHKAIGALDVLTLLFKSE